VVDVLEYFRLVGYLEAFPELGDMEDIMKLRQFCR
jgi:hypothetical protein